MRKIITGAMVSLDGVMQAPGGPEEDPSGGFAHGGWVPPYWDDALSAAMDETFAAPFDLLLGRRTYDIFAAYWPHIQVDPTASDFDRLNADIARTFNRSNQVRGDAFARHPVLAEQPRAAAATWWRACAS